MKRSTIQAVKRSSLARWREQVVADALNAIKEGYNDIADDQLDAYTRGIIRGYQECVSTLIMQQIIKIIID